MTISRKLKQDEQAVAIIEFALILPVLMLMLYGVIEVTRYVYFSQKLDSTSAQISNLINQNYDLSDASLNTIFNATTTLMEPFDSSNLTMVVTSFTKKTLPTVDPKISVDWQEIRGQSGVASLFAPSGDCGGDSTKAACNVLLPPASVLPTPMTFKKNDQIIVVEIFSKYTPIFMKESSDSIINKYSENGNLIINSDIAFYKYTIARPRYGSFSSKP